jgi:hypothetical protein
MWARMDRSELEARQAAAERAQATAAPDVASQLRTTAQAEADARQQAADAQIRNDQAQAASASALAGDLASRRQQLEADDTTYEAWASRTRDARESGNKAAAELHRRGHTQPQPEHQARPGTGPQKMSDGWRQFDTDADALERSIEHQRQAATEAGQPWPPRPQPEPEPGTESAASPDWWHQFEADADALERSIERQRQAAADTGQPWPPERHPEAGTGPEGGPATRQLRTEPADPDVRLSNAIAGVEDAARRFSAEQADRDARSQYAARISRPAEAQPEAGATLDAETPADVEMEL